MRYIIAFMLCVIGLAADYPVAVVHSGKDIVGNSLYRTLVERVGSTLGMRNANPKQKHFVISVVTVSDSEYKTNYSVVVGFRQNDDSLTTMMDHFAGYCGSQRVSDTASDIILKLSEYIKLIENASNNTEDRGRM